MKPSRFSVASPRMRRLPGGHFRRLAQGDECPIYDLLCACSCCYPAKEYEIIGGPAPSFMRARSDSHRNKKAFTERKRSSRATSRSSGGGDSRQGQRTLSWADTRGSSSASVEGETERDHGSRRGGPHTSRSSSNVPETPHETPPGLSPSVTPAVQTPRVTSAPEARPPLSKRASGAVPAVSRGESAERARKAQASAPETDKRSNQTPLQKKSTMKDQPSEQKALPKEAELAPPAEDLKASKLVVEVAGLNGKFAIPGKRQEVFLLCGYISDSLTDLLNHSRNRSPKEELTNPVGGIVDIPMVHRFVLPMEGSAAALRLTLVVIREVEENLGNKQKMTWKLNDVGSIVFPIKELQKPTTIEWNSYPVSLSSTFASTCSADLRLKFSSFALDNGPPIPEDVVEPFKPQGGKSKKSVRGVAKHEAAIPSRPKFRGKTGWSITSPVNSFSSSEFYTDDMDSDHFNDLCSVAPSPLPPFRMRSSAAKEQHVTLKLKALGSGSLHGKQQKGDSSSSAQSKLTAAAASGPAVYAIDEHNIVDCRDLLEERFSLDCFVDSSGSLQPTWKLQHQQASVLLRQLLQQESEAEQQQDWHSRAEMETEETPLSSCRLSTREHVFPLSSMPRRKGGLAEPLRRYSTARDREGACSSSSRSKRMIFNAPRCAASLPWSSSSISSSPRHEPGTPSTREASLSVFPEAEADVTSQKGGQHSQCARKHYGCTDTPRSSCSSSNCGSLPKAICPPSKKAPPQLPQQPRQQRQATLGSNSTLQEISSALDNLLRDIEADTARVQCRMHQGQQQQQRAPLPAVPKARQPTEKKVQPRITAKPGARRLPVPRRETAVH